jgi:hypothetical protein
MSKMCPKYVQPGPSSLHISTPGLIDVVSGEVNHVPYQVLSTPPPAMRPQVIRQALIPECDDDMAGPWFCILGKCHPLTAVIQCWK